MTQIPDTDIEAAARIAGVDYTQAERALLAESLALQIARAQRRRSLELGNTLHPATVFDPRLPGFRMPEDTGLIAPKAPPRPLPEDDTDIAFATVVELSAWVRSRALSSERLTRIYLDRIDRFGPKLECIAHATPELALSRARAADAELAAGHWRGPLHGIPYGCKDLLDTAGIPTCWGAEPYAGRIPDSDSAVVAKLAKAGAVLIAKTTLGALAYGDIWNGGRTRNPWNPEEGSTGSSAGSGSGTSAAMFGFSIGTETLGSIMGPSTRCGIVGLRPSFGRVSRAGAMALCWSLDKIGPMCRGVDDTALVLAALNGFDEADPGSIAAPFSDDASADITSLRVGYFPKDSESPFDQAMLNTARSLGIALIPLSRAPLPYETLIDLLYAEAAAAFEELTLSNRDDLLKWQAPIAWPTGFRRARFLSAVDHIQLDRLRRLVMIEARHWFEQVDVILGSPLAGPMATITNFTGHPCLALPRGFQPMPTRSPGGLNLPVGLAEDGVQHRVPHAAWIWGRLYEEGPVLRLGRALEAAFGVSSERPPGFG